MKRFSVLMMIAFAIVFVSACTKPGTSGDAGATNPPQKVTNKNPVAGEKSVKDQIAQRNQQKDQEKKNEEVKQQGAEDVNLDALATCLTEKGLKMYGTSRCSHCKKQKEKFGTAFEKIDFTDCDKEREKCKDAGVQGYPTWADNEGILFPGDQSLESLAKLAQCEY